MDKYDTIIALLTEQNEILKGLLAAKPTSGLGYTLWDTEQEDFLIAAYTVDNLELDEIIDQIKSKFNIERTKGAITSRLRKLGIEVIATKPAGVTLDEINPTEEPKF